MEKSSRHDMCGSMRYELSIFWTRACC